MPPLCWYSPTRPNLIRKPEYLDPKGTLGASNGDTTPSVNSFCWRRCSFLLMWLSSSVTAAGEQVHLNWPRKVLKQPQRKKTLWRQIRPHQHIATLDWEIEWMKLGLNHVWSLLSTNNDNRSYWCFKTTWRESGANGAGWWAVTSLYWDWRRLRLNCVDIKQSDDAYWPCP